MTKLRLSWPNRISILRILLIIPFVICMLHQNEPGMSWVRYLAVGLFGLMALSDALDGYLARRHFGITSLGKFLDPLADKLLITTTTILLAVDATSVPGMKLPDIVAVIIIGKDVYITIGSIILYLVLSEFHIMPAFAGKLSTAMQLLMVIGILLSPELTSIWEGFRYMAQVLWWSVAALALIAVVVYTRYGTRYLLIYEHRHSKAQ